MDDGYYTNSEGKLILVKELQGQPRTKCICHALEDDECICGALSDEEDEDNG